MLAISVAKFLAAGCAAAKAAGGGGINSSSCSEALQSTALGGRNIKDYTDTTMNVTRCCEFCDSLNGCIGWTLDARNWHCYAKDRIDTPKSSGSYSSISGIKPGALPGPPKPVPVPPPIHPVPGDKPVSPPAGAKNVLMIICDDMRPQIGAYGHAFMHTPHIDSLAASGTLFTR